MSECAELPADPEENWDTANPLLTPDRPRPDVPTPDVCPFFRPF